MSLDEMCRRNGIGSVGHYRKEYEEIIYTFCQLMLRK